MLQGNKLKMAFLVRELYAERLTTVQQLALFHDVRGRTVFARTVRI